MSWVRDGGCSPEPEHLPSGRLEAETPKLCHALPLGPCLISEHTTESWPVVPKLVKYLEPTTFALKRSLSKDFTVGSVPLGTEPSDPLLLGMLLILKPSVFDRRGLSSDGHMLN